MSIPLHVCASCPRAQGKSCCEVEGRHDLATLTGGDIARIRASTGRPARFFVDEEIFDPEAAHAHAMLRPLNTHAVQGGVRRHLRAAGGACVFHLPERGCTLDAVTRPLLCQLYPIEFDAFGNPSLAPSGSCHAEATLDGLPEVLTAMGLTLERACALHSQALRELAADARLTGD
jgi:hypothetical protein